MRDARREPPTPPVDGRAPRLLAGVGTTRRRARHRRRVDGGELAVITRMRWRIAHLLNKLPGQCRAGLVSWALDGPAASRRRGDNPLPWSPITDTCRQISPPNDRCYCGKICARTEDEVAT